MKCERIVTVHYTFVDGDIVCDKLSGGIVRCLIRANKKWMNMGDTHNTGLLDKDIQQSLEALPDEWRYLGNKYEVFE